MIKKSTIFLILSFFLLTTALTVSAKISVQTFCDFSSERCDNLEINVNKLQEKFPTEIVIEKHYYAEDINENLVFPMLALECAKKQGGMYAPYEDLLLANRGAVSREDLKGYAHTLGLKRENFSFCLDVRMQEKEVKAKLEYAEGKGITTTPTVMVRGEKYERVTAFTNLVKITEYHLGLRETIEPKEIMQEIESEIVETEEEIIDWRTEPVEETEAAEIPEPIMIDPFVQMYGEKPTRLFEKIHWNIKKFFWSISK